MKPTYKELQKQLTESRREFTAANATIHNLELKVEQVVAENGQMLRLLTDISENHDEYVNADEYLYAGVPMDYVSEINAYVSRDVDAENPFKATDAYLAEVRASAIPEGYTLAPSRTITVKLPKAISVLHRRDFIDAHRAIYAYPEAELKAALAAAGIQAIEGEVQCGGKCE